MGWTYGIGALLVAQCGAGMFKLFRSNNNTRMDVDAETKPGIVAGVIHATVVSFCMPATRAIFTSCFAAATNTKAAVPKPRALSATSSKSLDENGSALFVF